MSANEKEQAPKAGVNEKIEPTENIGAAKSEKTVINLDKTETPGNTGTNGTVNSEQIDIDLDIDDSDYDVDCWSRFVEKIEKAIGSFLSKYNVFFTLAIKAGIFMAYMAYFIYCMTRSFGDEDSIMLLVITIIIVLIIVNKLMTAKGIEFSLPESMKTCFTSEKAKRTRRIVRIALYFVASGAIIAFTAVDILQHEPRNIQSVFGLLCIIAISFLGSVKPSRVNWHPVFWGCVIQFGCAVLTLRTQFGYDVFDWMGRAVNTFVGYSDAGSIFVLGENFRNMGLAFSISGVIIFFNSVIFLLFYLGVIEFIVKKMGYFLLMTMDTGPVESVTAAASIFVGLTESSLLIRPYLPTVTKSEIHTIMTCGFASIAGSTMGLFIRFGAPANHLLTAAVISAPAALAVSKLMYPETQKVDYGKQKEMQMVDKSEKRNALSVCADGAVMALSMVGAVMANMLAFTALLDMVNTFLLWFGRNAGYEGLTFERICSWVLYPIAYLMGVEAEDCGKVGSLIGTKLVATPVLGYARLGQMRQNRREVEDFVSNTNNSWYWDGDNVVLAGLNKTLEFGFMSDRSEVIATYALCGYSAFTSIGICLGVLTALYQPRKKEYIELVTRAFIAGNIASFLTGAIAGVMYTR